MKNTHLFLIDYQYDFCHPNGSLFVPGGQEDVDRTALMIDKLKFKISEIHVSLDSHHAYDIGHPNYWIDLNGKHPEPFTQITLQNVLENKWRPVDITIGKYIIEYLAKLQAEGRYCAADVWPIHCLVGSEGQRLMPNLLDAINNWEIKNHKSSNSIFKGTNPHTEHYSVIKPATQTNKLFNSDVNNLLDSFYKADVVLIAGEASTHCVSSTVKDLAIHFGYMNKFVYLKDACSPVPGFEKLEEKFLNEMIACGMCVSTTAEVEEIL